LEDDSQISYSEVGLQVIYSGSELDDSATLLESQVEDGSVLFLVQRTVKSVAVIVKTLKDKFFSVNVDPLTSILELKNKVFEQDNTWEVARQRIIFKGKELLDSEVLLNCGLCDSIPSVHVVMRPPTAGVTRRKKDSDGEKCPSPKGRGERCSTRFSSGGVKIKAEPTESVQDYYSDLGDMGGDCVVPMDFEHEWAEYSISSQSDISQLGWEGDQLSVQSPVAASVLSGDVSPSGADASSSFADMMTTAGRVVVHRSAEKCSVKEVDALPSTQGRAYDLSKVDDKLRKRLVKNRLSAERSRQRKQAHVETLEFELSCCRSENEHLRQRVASLEAQLASFSLGSTPKSSFCQQIALTVHA